VLVGSGPMARPVVAINVGSVPDVVVDGETGAGRLAKPSAASLAGAMSAPLANLGVAPWRAQPARMRANTPDGVH
jgi:hypothetical protein